MKSGARMFEVVNYEDLQDGAWNPSRMSNSANALGGAPAPILYLWVFERPDSLSGQLISHGWVQLGPIQLLVSADARIGDQPLRTDNEIRRSVSKFGHDVGTYKCPEFADLEAFANYRGYPINALWCADAVWQSAFKQTAKISQYFVVDVTAEDNPAGLTFELEHLFSAVHSSRIVFILDRYRADLDEIRSFLSAIWEKTGSGQATKSKLPPPVITYSSAKASYLAKSTWSQWTGRPSVPLANRAATHVKWW